MRKMNDKSVDIMISIIFRERWVEMTLADRGESLRHRCYGEIPNAPRFSFSSRRQNYCLYQGELAFSLASDRYQTANAQSWRGEALGD